MIKIDRGSCHLLAAVTLALATGAVWANAHAALDPSRIDQTATATSQRKMAACKHEFISLRDMCAAEAGYGEPVPRDTLSPAQHQALAQETTRYQAALAACKGLAGDSNRTVCMSRAGNDATLAVMN